jgi:hypothetical protein
MSRFFAVSGVIALSLVIVALGFGPGAAVAQEAGNTTNTTGENVTGTPVDSRLTLTGWSYDEGTFTLNLELTGERPKTVTISESTQPARGSQQFAIRKERILPGETTIRMTTAVNGGHSALSITTEESIENERGVVVSTGEPSGRNPFRAFGGTSGLLSGVGISVLLSALAALYVLWREETGVIEA